MSPNAMPLKVKVVKAPRKPRKPRTIRNTQLSDQLRQKGFAK
jgi:hypothetical protein